MSLRTLMRCAACLVAVLALPAPAQADGGRGARVPLPAAYVQECGSCHAAFPPGLLPAASWQRLMGNLKDHFGTDASLDDANTRSLAAWLAAHAGARREAPPGDRITRAAWFQREHREVGAATWKHAAVGSATNCGACHTQAAAGSYRESELRLPR